MDRIVNYADTASVGIEVMLDQLEFVKKALEEKGGKLGELKIFLTFVYLVGVILCAVWALTCGRISAVLMEGELGFFVTLTASVSSTLFFGILILRNLMEVKYYKVIFNGQHNIAKINRHLEKIKRKSLEYQNLLNSGDVPIDSAIELGEDVSTSIENIKIKIESLEKNKSNIVDTWLTVVYYVAAFSVGAFFILYIQNGFVSTICDMIADLGVEAESASSLAEVFYGICAAVAIFGGPIFAKYYFENIRLVELKDSLIFLIAGSGILAFIAAVIAVGLIAGIIALVWLIIQAIVAVIVFIFAAIIIIAIVTGLLSGG